MLSEDAQRSMMNQVGKWQMPIAAGQESGQEIPGA
jgi:hypothetical protein